VRSQGGRGGSRTPDICLVSRVVRRSHDLRRAEAGRHCRDQLRRDRECAGIAWRSGTRMARATGPGSVLALVGGAAFQRKSPHRLVGSCLALGALDATQPRALLPRVPRHRETVEPTVRPAHPTPPSPITEGQHDGRRHPADLRARERAQFLFVSDTPRRNGREDPARCTGAGHPSADRLDPPGETATCRCGPSRHADR
jgi:hypothetical protein